MQGLQPVGLKKYLIEPIESFFKVATAGRSWMGLF